MTWMLNAAKSNKIETTWSYLIPISMCIGTVIKELFVSISIGTVNLRILYFFCTICFEATDNVQIQINLHTVLLLLLMYQGISKNK